MLIKNYFYGPVPSRRLGFSLGVDLLPKKTCSFNCLYCQLGLSESKTMRRFSFVKLSKLKKELKEVIDKHPKINYITIAGSGEPTLHKGLDKIIAAIKGVTKNKYPVAVITNSSLLYRKEVRNELRGADLIVPSLDAATNKTFLKINRPFKGVALEKIIRGLIQLRKEFKGKIWLEIMFVAGVNDSRSEAEEFKKIIDQIKPDKVQLNFPVRPARVKVFLPSRSKIEMIKKILGKSSKFVIKFSLSKRSSKGSVNLEKDILNFLKVRPASLDDLLKSLSVNPNQISKQLFLLLTKKLIKEHRVSGVKYFIIND